jgi:hypothetical protein
MNQNSHLEMVAGDGSHDDISLADRHLDEINSHSTIMARWFSTKGQVNVLLGCSILQLPIWGEQCLDAF